MRKELGTTEMWFLTNSEVVVKISTEKELLANIKAKRLKSQGEMKINYFRERNIETASSCDKYGSLW